MFNYRITFVSPWYLLVPAVLLPVLWWYSYRALAVLGPARRWIVLVLRSLVVVLLFLALAEIQMVRVSDRLTVIYVLDQSLSIPEDRRKAMIEYVNAEVQKHWHTGDRVGVIVFGRDAAIEIPPFDEPLLLTSQIESPLERDYTNLAGALKLAQASFPEDAAKRIVVISDGNQNLGDGLEQAQGIAAAGIGIDVAPVRYRSRAEIAVERLSIPDDVRRGQPFDLRVVVNNVSEPGGRAAGQVGGRLMVSQLIDDQTVVLSDEHRTLLPGKNVYTLRQQIDAPNFYTYEARFVPDRREDDTFLENNRATAFTHVRGKGQVLLIEDQDSPGEFNILVDRLRRQGLELTVRQASAAFSGLAELQPFDTVLLANVPREHFTEGQIEMLVRNTQQMGAGLVMLGGQNSFGAGGWTNSELEKAMPVDFQIKSAKVVPRGALVMIMHASEMAEGNYWQKVVAHKAIEALGPQDYCGVIHWEGAEQWLWRGGLQQVGPNRPQMMARVDRMTPGDMPQFDPAMKMAQQGFAKVPDAAIRHMIIISDGDPSAPSGGVKTALRDLSVTVSTVAIGAHGPAESGLLSRIAAELGGKYYQVNSGSALPKIFQREARRVARPLIWEKFPVRPRVKYPHEMISGVGDRLPPLKGFVLTGKKDNPLVETILTAPDAEIEENSTILAAWTYGLGRTAAFTSDAGARWTTAWTGEPLYDQFFAQMVRWSMRPSGDSGKFTTSTEVGDGKVRIIVNALDKNDEFLNFLSMSGTVVGPDLKPIPMTMEQTAPGRYVGTFAGRDAGSYFLMISPGAGMTPIRTGVNVPYSDEFRDRGTNEALLSQLAALVPKGGSAGKLIEDPKGADKLDVLLAVNTFRHDLPKATTSQDIWHYMVLLGSCLFFFDVFFRRVQVSLAWAPPLAVRAYRWVRRRGPLPEKVEFIERLRSRKAEVGDRLEQLRAATRFQMPETPVDAVLLDEKPKPGGPPHRPAPPPAAGEKKEEETYTERLLKAKKKVWEERDKE